MRRFVPVKTDARDKPGVDVQAIPERAPIPSTH